MNLSFKKIEALKKEKLPDNTILVTMDVRSLYTNMATWSKFHKT